ncbi:MAG: hypothetical protein JSV56_09060 [Methanomassiliicoccales archaeon]|nr:MAG: hypothetical protein JSV56_09060 [Methanomassiliicoccales archaeon]
MTRTKKSKKSVKKGKKKAIVKKENRSKGVKSRKKINKENMAWEDKTLVLCNIYTECNKLLKILEPMAEIYSGYDVWEGSEIKK